MPIRTLLALLLVACGGGGSASSPDAAVDASIAPPGAACPVTGYAPCGGDLVGSWSFAGNCPEAPGDVPCESPFDAPACAAAGNSQTCTLDPEGSMTFTATDVHILRDLFVDVRYVFTPECLAAARPDETTPEARCSAISNPPKLECSFAASACTCVGRVGPETIDDTVAYTVTGSSVSLGGELNASYCVASDGSRLTLDFDPHPMSWRYWVLTK